MDLLQQLSSRLVPWAIDVGRLGLWLALLAALFVPLERYFGTRHTARPNVDRWHDIAYYFISNLLPALLLSIPLALAATVLRHVTPAALPAAVAALPMPARLGLAFVVGEIGFYWGHRMTHRVPYLWRYHAVHHAAEPMSFLANTRNHPIDMVFTRLCGLLPLLVLGLAGPSATGSTMPVALLLIGTVWGFFIHANLRWRFGPLEWLVATPAFHHWHHSRNDHIDHNFASTLPVLDRLFGTHYLPSHWPAEVGLRAPLAPTLTAQLLDPVLPPKATRRVNAGS